MMVAPCTHLALGQLGQREQHERHRPGPRLDIARALMAQAVVVAAQDRHHVPVAAWGVGHQRGGPYAQSTTKGRAATAARTYRGCLGRSRGRPPSRAQCPQACGASAPGTTPPRTSLASTDCRPRAGTLNETSHPHAIPHKHRVGAQRDLYTRPITHQRRLGLRGDSCCH
jgi:hypothetical protein